MTVYGGLFVERRGIWKAVVWRLTVGDAVKLCRLESLSCVVCGVRAGARFATRLARSAILYPTGTAASNVSFLRKERSQEPRRRSLVSARPRIDRTVESHARRRRQYASSVLRLSKERIASQRARLSVHAIAIMIVAMMQLTLSHAGPCRRPHVS